MAPTTKQSYKTGQDAFQQFCTQFQVWKLGPIYPTNEITLCYFATFLAKTVQHSTIKVYLAAVKNDHLLHNTELPLHSFKRLHYLLRGIKRFQGTSQFVRKPITLLQLDSFFAQLQPFSAGNSDSKMLWAAICLAFFGFMRISEFTCTQTFVPSEHLTLQDITFSPSPTLPSCMKVVLKASKADPFRKGITLTIGALNSRYCPVQALQNYIKTTRSFPATGPLFQYRTGKYLTKSAFTKEIRNLLNSAGFPATEYAGHSFRIGAATAAAQANLPPWLIKSMGRWASDCFERYIRTPEATLINATKQMVSGVHPQLG